MSGSCAPGPTAASWCAAIPAGSCAKAICGRMDRPATSSRAPATASPSTTGRAGAGWMTRWSRRCDGPASSIRRTGRSACKTAFDSIAEMAAQYPPERVAELSGVAPGDLAAAADVIAGVVLGRVLRLERRRPKPHRNADRSRHLDPLRADRQLRPQGRQRAGQRRAFRRHLGAGFAVAGAEEQGARPRQAAARAGPQRLGDRTRCLSGGAGAGALSRAHAGVVRHQRAGVAAGRGDGAPRRWQRWSSTFTPTSSSMRRRAMPTSCCRSRRPGSGKGCAPASTSASKDCVACSCGRRRSHRSARRGPTPTLLWSWRTARFLPSGCSMATWTRGTMPFSARPD